MEVFGVVLRLYNTFGSSSTQFMLASISLFEGILLAFFSELGSIICDDHSGDPKPEHYVFHEEVYIFYFYDSCRWFCFYLLYEVVYGYDDILALLGAFWEWTYEVNSPHVEWAPKACGSWSYIPGTPCNASSISHSPGASWARTLHAL